MHLRLGLLLGVLFALLLPATALAGPTVSVRVEGASSTLLPAKQVTLGDIPYSAGGTTCPADSAFAALDTATAGNWDRANFFNVVLGENHSFADSDYWAVWVGRAGGFVYGNGICSQTLQAGDELLLLRRPLATSELQPHRVPAEAQRRSGDRRPRRADDGQGRRVPPGRDGHARIGERRSAGGRRGDRGRRHGHDRCRRNGDADADGARPVDGSRRDAGHAFASIGRLRDRRLRRLLRHGQALAAGPAGDAGHQTRAGAHLGLGEHQRFARGKGPRELKGIVEADASGIKDVRLRLTRTVGKRCERFDSVKERWVKAVRCGVENAPFFSIGSSAAWSYLLPAALTKGRYVLDTQTVDGAGNVTRGASRGSAAAPRTRVVFFVG